MSQDEIKPEAAIEVAGSAVSGTLVPVGARLPATTQPVAAKTGQRRRRWLGLALLFLILAAGGGTYWWMTRPEGLPPGIASGNGRLEADEIDIDTKFAGRVAKLFVDEGDMVKAGQTVALMDVQDLEAQLGKAQATVVQTQKALDEARANVEQQKAQVLFARQELDRARTLVKNDFMSKEMLDQRQQQMNGATATYAALTAHVGQAEQALDAAKHDVQLLQVNIADNRLVTPVDGRIQYKISNVGEVLPAGGKVFTMLDTSYVYMDVYLPTEEAGRITLGTDALITLDAMPHLALPAKVTFLATEAQFTPKAVETKTERDKFMFRVKVRVDQNLLRAHADAVRTGLPGTAYIRFSPAVTWPSWLQANIAK